MHSSRICTDHLLTICLLAWGIGVHPLEGCIHCWVVMHPLEGEHPLRSGFMGVNPRGESRGWIQGCIWGRHPEDWGAPGWVHTFPHASLPCEQSHAQQLKLGTIISLDQWRHGSSESTVINDMKPSVLLTINWVLQCIGIVDDNGEFEIQG